MYAWKELFKYLYLLWMVTQRLAEKRVIAGPGRVIVVINLILKEPLLRETSDDITVLVKISLKRLFRFMLSIFFFIWSDLDRKDLLPTIVCWENNYISHKRGRGSTHYQAQ